MNVTTREPTICVDLGKTRCRVRVRMAGHTVSATGDGLPGLAAPGAAAAAMMRIGEVLTRALAGTAMDSLRGARIGIGAAGALTAPDAAAELARCAAERFVGRAAVASDVVTAHIGAFSGGTGVCVIVGTGAVALAAGAQGRTSRRDGYGLTVGDAGSGAWLGRAGLRAAELAAADAGPATVLRTRLDSAAAVLAEASTRPDGAALLGSFAPHVLAAAHGGDEVAAHIVRSAVAELVGTARAAAHDVGERRLALCGGVVDDEWFRSQLSDAAAAAGLLPQHPDGDALAGAALLAAGDDLVWEGSVHRG